MTLKNFPVRFTFTIRAAPTGTFGVASTARGAATGPAPAAGFAGAGSSAGSNPSNPDGDADVRSSATRSTEFAATDSLFSNMLSDVAAGEARYASEFVVVASTPLSTARVASLRIRSATCEGVKDRELARIVAAMPAT